MNPTQQLLSEIQERLDKLKEIKETKEYPKGILMFRWTIAPFKGSLDGFALSSDDFYDKWVDAHMAANSTIHSVRNSKGEVLEVGMEVVYNNHLSPEVRRRGIIRRFEFSNTYSDYMAGKKGSGVLLAWFKASDFENIDSAHPLPAETYESVVLSQEPIEWISLDARVFTEQDAKKVSTFIKLLNLSFVLNEGEKFDHLNKFILRKNISKIEVVCVGVADIIWDLIPHHFNSHAAAQKAIDLIGEQELIEFFK